MSIVSLVPTFIASLFLAAAAFASPPPAMMANVYRLTEAAAVLTVCIESAAYRNLPKEAASHAQDLVTRLAGLVRNIATYYGDETLYPIFESTKARIASEPAMKRYAEKKYRYCGGELFRDMEAYVSENEKLINGYLRRRSPNRELGKLSR